MKRLARPVFPQSLARQIFSSPTMQIQDIWDLLERSLFSKPSRGTNARPVFNLYKETNLKIEQVDGAKIRRANLYNYLVSFLEPPSVLIVGEAPGWRGCRFSGVPFTSESQLQSASLPFTGNPSSLRPKPYREASATIFWRVMAAYHPRFLVWNCVPFHLYRPGEPLSNRRPSNREIARYLPFLAHLISLLQPRRVAAVGRCAQWALNSISIPALPLRHPSHGGAVEFEQGIHKIFKS
jgi:uracil-DNA glycosylase